MEMTADGELDFLDVLGPRGRKLVERKAERITIPACEALFLQAEASDALFILVSGSLGVYACEAGGEESLIAMVRPGETVGEMGVITGVARTATVRAIRDSELLKFSRERFYYYIRKSPELMHGIGRILVNRLSQTSKGTGTRIEPKTVAFFAATPGVNSAETAQRLAGRLRAEGVTVAVVGAGDADQDRQWFSALEDAHDHVLLHCQSGDGDTDDSSDWVALCARQADRIIVVADSRETSRSRLPSA